MGQLCMACAFRLHLVCVRVCALSAISALMYGQSVCTLNRLTPSLPILSTLSVDSIRNAPVHFHWLIKLKPQNPKSCRTGRTFQIPSPYTSKSSMSLSGVYSSHLRVSLRVIWDIWKHAVWWGELPSRCRSI